MEGTHCIYQPLIEPLVIQPLAEAAQERIPGYSYPSQMERFRVVEELRTNDYQRNHYVDSTSEVVRSWEQLRLFPITSL